MDNNYSLKDALNEIRFDETTILFGFQQGEYIDELESMICEKNKVYIFEPNKIDFEKYKDSIKYSNVILIDMEDENLESIFTNIITKKNFLNVNIQIYGDYDVLYKCEYEKFKKLIDKQYTKCTVATVSSDTFKYTIVKNIMSNINQLNNSYKFDSYLDTNKNVPAIIVSAGPSLDINIKDLIKNKEILDKFLIIAGNRTLEPLLKAGIKPDLVMSIDPQDITYNMMENCLDCGVPLIFCEKSNSKLVKNYKGNKIAISQGIFNYIDTLDEMIPCVSGGSIVHTSTDIAFLMGCNPIVFIGQDFGYTDFKGHAYITENKIDKPIKKDGCINVKDVYGKDIYTSELLNLYKENLEYFINIYKEIRTDIEFYNASYGADIEGTEFKELKDILCVETCKNEKSKFKYEDKICINEKVILVELESYLEETIKNVHHSKFICENILKEPTMENILKFEYVIKTIDNFMKDDRSIYIESYIETFLIYIKEKLFKMKAKEYSTLSKDIIYQSKIFKEYMDDLEIFINEIQGIIKNC